MLINIQKNKDRKKVYLRISLTSFLLIGNIVYLVYGKISAAIRKITPVTTATFLSLFSNVFLLPYSLPQAIPPIPSPSHPFGDINITDPINAIHARISIIIKKVRIFCYNKNKCGTIIPIWLVNSTRMQKSSVGSI